MVNSTDPSGDDRVIELGSVSQPEPCASPPEQPSVPQRLPPTSSILRYVIAILAGAVVTLTVTLLVIEEPFATEPTPPATMDELEEWLLDEVADVAGDNAQARALHGIEYRDVYLAMQPGTYRMAVKCGLLSEHGSALRDVTLQVLTDDYDLDVSLPCPSTTIWLDHGFEFDDLSPLVVLAGRGAQFDSFIVAVAVVPDGEDR